MRGPARSRRGDRRLTARDDHAIAQFARPGPLRDQLVAAILRGEKTATSSLRSDYRDDGADLPRVGAIEVVVDSSGEAVAEIETTEVRILPMREIDRAFARDEGEGFATVADWRDAHERFWREEAGDEGVELADETVVVAERFRLVRRLGG